MSYGPPIAAIAALIGDPARATILASLMGGEALTAGELARLAGVTPQTASSHLAKLTDAHLIAVERQGRHRYYRLVSADVAQALETFMTVATARPQRPRLLSPRDRALHLARTCYDHMAGRLAIALTDSLVAHRHLVLADGAGLITGHGQRLLDDFGIGLKQTPASRRPLCRTCLDWSERRPHLSGRLGAALLARLLELGWLIRVPHSRALTISRTGEMGLIRTFGIAATWREPACSSATPAGPRQDDSA